MHEEFDGTKHNLTYAHLRGTPSVGTGATAALELDPNEGPEEFAYVRAKENPTEFRAAASLDQPATYLDLAELCARRRRTGDCSDATP